MFSGCERRDFLSRYFPSFMKIFDDIFENAIMKYNNELSLGEYVCLLEMRTPEKTECSFCRFKIKNLGQLLIYRIMICHYMN